MNHAFASFDVSQNHVLNSLHHEVSTILTIPNICSDACIFLLSDFLSFIGSISERWILSVWPHIRNHFCIIFLPASRISIWWFMSSSGFMTSCSLSGGVIFIKFSEFCRGAWKNAWYSEMHWFRALVNYKFWLIFRWIFFIQLDISMHLSQCLQCHCRYILFNILDIFFVWKIINNTRKDYENVENLYHLCLYFNYYFCIITWHFIPCIP